MILSMVLNIITTSLATAVDAKVLFGLDCFALVVPLNQLTQAARACLTIDQNADALRQLRLPTKADKKLLFRVQVHVLFCNT